MCLYIIEVSGLYDVFISIRRACKRSPKCLPCVLVCNRLVRLKITEGVIA